MNGLLRSAVLTGAVLLVTACSDGTLHPSNDATMCVPTGCVAACAKGSHNIASISNGCEVWQCCVLDDAGASTPDAQIDACAPTACTASCPVGAHNFSRMVNGCEVWECCLPDDGGTPTLDAQTLMVQRAPGCPARAPTDGDFCTASWLDCEYGGDAQGRCATVASCWSGKWHLTKTAGCGNEAICPASFAAVPQGAACPDTFVDACEYPEATCGCTACLRGGESKFVWRCGAWSHNTDPACDLLDVRVGDACTTPDQTCWYGSPCFDRFKTRPPMTCRDGYWGIAVQNFACPIAPACP